MVSQATLRYLRTSAQKTRLVVDQIRGRDVAEALGILKASHKRVARHIEKLLNSAIANAENREERVDVDRLFVAKAWVDEGPSEGRGRAGTMGRYFPRISRKAHVTLQLDVKK
ncbi:MAG TPA: 50S ribosomal protein L22 [Acidobacteriota bacterium]|nr:50S ribosomal protein L22 [Acidobacteriota bacterium]